MAVTEQDLIELAQTMRDERTREIRDLQVELEVKILEAHNRDLCTSSETVAALIKDAVDGLEQITLEDVRHEVEAGVVPGVSADEVRDLIVNEATPGVSIEDVRTEVESAQSELRTLLEKPQATPDIEAPESEKLKGGMLKLKVFVNELADRVGVPRMEG